MRDLEEIKALPENLVSIEAGPPNADNVGYLGAFADNKLTTLTIPSSVKYIGNHAFANNKLTSITIPNHITKIGAEAFYGNLIKHVVIPDSVTSLGKGAFTSGSLKTLELPHSYIGKDLTGLFPKNVEITYR